MTAVQGASTNTVSQEWVHLWINTDGSIDVQYNITYRNLSGSPQGIFELGMPESGFKISYVRDLSNNPLTYTDVSGGRYYGIDITVGTLLNHNYTFLVYATVPSMVSPDSTNSSNVGMSFYTPTFDTATGSIVDLRVRMELPSGVTSSDVEYPTGLPFDNVITGGTNIAVYWQRSNWPATQKLTTGVSFPAKFVNLGPSIWFYPVIILGIVAVIVALIVIFRRIRKAIYEKPKISIEALGAARGLTAVEAAVVVESKPLRVLTMILFGLLRKRFIMVKETTPLIKLETVDASVRDTSPPRYYEIDYLKAIESDGSLDERGLARTYLSLRDNVNWKLRGYSRVDTVNYYKSVVNDAWNQVTQAGTPELKGDAIESNMEWLLMDEKYDEKFKQTFPPEIILMPRPSWWWYWHGPYFPRSQIPTPSLPSGSPTEVKPIPAQEWANNVVRGLETTTNNIVKNVQDFTNKLVAPQAQSSQPVRQGSNCVCACAHCACACACVGCACACAGGGAR